MKPRRANVMPHGFLQATNLKWYKSAHKVTASPPSARWVVSFLPPCKRLGGRLRIPGPRRHAACCPDLAISIGVDAPVLGVVGQRGVAQLVKCPWADPLGSRISRLGPTWKSVVPRSASEMRQGPSGHADPMATSESRSRDHPGLVGSEGPRGRAEGRAGDRHCPRQRGVSPSGGSGG